MSSTVVRGWAATGGLMKCFVSRVMSSVPVRVPLIWCAISLRLGVDITSAERTNNTWQRIRKRLIFDGSGGSPRCFFNPQGDEDGMTLNWGQSMWALPSFCVIPVPRQSLHAFYSNYLGAESYKSATTLHHSWLLHFSLVQRCVWYSVNSLSQALKPGKDPFTVSSPQPKEQKHTNTCTACFPIPNFLLFIYFLLKWLQVKSLCWWEHFNLTTHLFGLIVYLIVGLTTSVGAGRREVFVKFKLEI